MSEQSFLERRKEELRVAPNPCQLDLGFNGAKGFFTTYDPSIEEKADRRQKVEKKNLPVQLIVLDMAKKAQYFEKAKRNGNSINIGTSYFKDYDTDHITVWENGGVAASGTYSEVKKFLNDNNAKIVDVYFCWSPTLNAAVTFTATGGKKNIMRSAWKAEGGWSASPFIQLSTGDEVGKDDDKASFTYFNIKMTLLGMDAVTEEMGAKCDEIGPAVLDYLDSAIAKSKEAAKAKAEAEKAEQDDPSELRKVGDPIMKAEPEEMEDVIEEDDEGGVDM